MSLEEWSSKIPRWAGSTMFVFRVSISGKIQNARRVAFAIQNGLEVPMKEQ